MITKFAEKSKCFFSLALGTAGSKAHNACQHQNGQHDCQNFFHDEYLSLFDFAAHGGFLNDGRIITHLFLLVNTFLEKYSNVFEIYSDNPSLSLNILNYIEYL